ncbi:DUF3010 family protein [Poseidonibacter lekithochrous]|uniref:DUF3010 family protein n=1 Tax=Poseidonibacter lekithochrous TaxID=1904463 RepID=UPI0008FCDF03|nr:DUF3010 family protein [Poseidonibacter lekithochrous]QKJ22685.1 DUF3010 domain-containing protein [Poseidonibacter lekithochrous]
MKLCGIELKASNTILSVIDFREDDDIIDYIDLKIKKITLEDDENQEDISKFSSSISSFLKENEIEKVFIKKRAKKGTFSGGAVTFKMEALIQLNSICEVELISSQSISSFEKKNSIIFPKALKKYQEQSYLGILATKRIENVI